MCRETPIQPDMWGLAEKSDRTHTLRFITCVISGAICVCETWLLARVCALVAGVTQHTILIPKTLYTYVGGMRGLICHIGVYRTGICAHEPVPAIGILDALRALTARALDHSSWTAVHKQGDRNDIQYNRYDAR